jgi:hypothetical protein
VGYEVLKAVVVKRAEDEDMFLRNVDLLLVL